MEGLHVAHLKISRKASALLKTGDSNAHCNCKQGIKNRAVHVYILVLNKLRLFQQSVFAADVRFMKVAMGTPVSICTCCAKCSKFKNLEGANHDVS